MIMFFWCLLLFVTVTKKGESMEIFLTSISGILVILGMILWDSLWAKKAGLMTSHVVL